MAFDVISILSTTANLMKKNKSSIDEGIYSSYKQIISGVDGIHSIVPIPKTLYPTIFLEANSKSEEYEQIGRSSRRISQLYFSIIPTIEYGIGQDPSKHFSSMEIMKLTQNIETIFRNNITLSGTVDWCNVENTEYSIFNKTNNEYVHMSKINLMITKRIT